MDSMGSLDTSLPGTSPPKQQADNREDLLSAFRAAALQVTKLYKTATTEQGKARSEGYQDALDDLLLFLDKENIGLSDGEGWRIRRWATERLDGRSAPQNVESDEEVPDRASSRSPALSRTQQPPPPRTQSIPRSVRTASPEQQNESTVTTHNIPPPIEEEEEEVGTRQIAAFSVPSQSTFTFRATQQYPQDADMIVSDLDSTDRAVPHRTASTGSLGNGRLTSSSSRSNARRANGRGSNIIGRGAGQKRKNNFDFSDFFGIDLGKDRQGGGGKRGRFA